MKRAILCLLLFPGFVNAEALYGAIVAERFEYREQTNIAFWDAQAYYGGDYQKLYVKTEGSRGNSLTEYAELQVLYSRALLPYFDLQLGLRLRDVNDRNITDAVVGLMGELPYAVDTTAELFVSEDGDVSLRTEFERDFLLSEKVLLQPRIEASFALQDVPLLGVESGLDELSVGLRFRYEITRRFAPYVGALWEESRRETTGVLGLRFSF